MRIEQLTFTRFIAAISIVIFHYGSGSFLFNNELVSFIFKQANVGVSYFYILSGFVMIIAYGNLKKINFFGYLKNRFARVYPVYFLAIFLIFGISLFKNLNILDLTLNMFMIQAWVPGKALTINTPGWSLSVEFFFYLLFPILLNLIYSTKKLKNITLFIILFWIASQIIFHLTMYSILKIPFYSIQDILYHPLMHLNEFLIGNLAGIFFIKKQKNYKREYSFQIIILMIILITVLKFPMGFNLHNGLLAIFFVPLILLISLNKGIFTKLLSKKPFVFLGEISFSLYILQAPVWMFFSDYRMLKYVGLNKITDFTTSFFIRLIILIIFSSLSYLYFEKPIRNYLKNIK